MTPVGDIRVLARRQHGVVERSQLRAAGFTDAAIKHRLARGRLYPVHRGVYAVGRREIGHHGRWMAATLACGHQAVLSHVSAGVLWGLLRLRPRIHVSVPLRVRRSPRGVSVHRRTAAVMAETVVREGIPVTSVSSTLIDLALVLDRDSLEAVIGEADRLNLIDPEALRRAVASAGGRPGAGVLGTVLDRHTFVLSRSRLERLFRPIARRSGLPRPLGNCRVNGYDVDFYWPDLGLVVETDGLRYHRTAAQQTRAYLRDQQHYAAELTPLRFSHAQIRFEPEYVERILASSLARIRRERTGTIERSGSPWPPQ